MRIVPKKTFYRIVAISLKTVLTIARWMPAKASMKFIVAIMQAIHPLLPNHQLAKENIKLAFPKKSKKEIDKMVKNIWINMAKTLAEYMFVSHRMTEDDVEVKGMEILEKIKKEKKPVIFFSAHIGNWEMMPMWAAYKGLDIYVPFTMPKNPYVAKILIESRNYGGNMVASQFGSVWELAKKLEENKAVGMLVDQRYKKKAQKIKFFNRDASANPTIAKLAKEYKCPIYPARCIRKENGKFQVQIFKAIKTPLDENKELDVNKTIQMIHKIIEQWIVEYPEQWIWTYNRWK